METYPRPSPAAADGLTASVLATEHLLAQSRAAEAYYRSLFEQAADAMLVTNAAGQYVDANSAASALLGYTREDLLRMRVPDVVAAGPEWTEAEYARFLHDRRWRAELTVRRQDGSTILVDAWASTTELPSGTLYVATLRDVSERHALERAQQEFVDTASHDLKTPLAAILGYAQLLTRSLRRPTPDLDKVARAAATIGAQARAMAELIDDLLDVSRIQVGALQLQTAPCELGACLDTVLARLAPEARTRVDVELPDAPVAGDWDHRRIEQVLANLVDNALKYSPPDTRVDVVVERHHAELAFAIHDRGMGIPADELPRLFQRFYRTPDALASGLSGTGLGLYICAGIIAAHGGRIWAESPGAGRGTTFRCTLPERLAPPGRARQADAPA